MRPIRKLEVSVAPHEFILIVEPLRRCDAPLTTDIAVLAEEQLPLAEIDDRRSCIAQALTDCHPLDHQHCIITMTADAEASICDVTQVLIRHIEH